MVCRQAVDLKGIQTGSKAYIPQKWFRPGIINLCKSWHLRYPLTLLEIYCKIFWKYFQVVLIYLCYKYVPYDILLSNAVCWLPVPVHMMTHSSHYLSCHHYDHQAPAHIKPHTTITFGTCLCLLLLLHGPGLDWNEHLLQSFWLLSYPDGPTPATQYHPFHSNLKVNCLTNLRNGPSMKFSNRIRSN